MFLLFVLTTLALLQLIVWRCCVWLGNTDENTYQLTEGRLHSAVRLTRSRSAPADLHPWYDSDESTEEDTSEGETDDVDNRRVNVHSRPNGTRKAKMGGLTEFDDTWPSEGA